MFQHISTRNYIKYKTYNVGLTSLFNLSTEQSHTDQIGLRYLGSHMKIYCQLFLKRPVVKTISTAYQPNANPIPIQANQANKANQANQAHK
jgi:hypothetical protein